ncbi:MAG: c-type cytochrome [Phycisphaerales bacterium]|nr:c-type cytochrome [Phycisphaerales bacterium]
MTKSFKVFHKPYLQLILLCFMLQHSISSMAQDGKALFIQNCASCHAIDRQLTGPALEGVLDRWPNKKNLYAWIHNNQAFLKTGDKYANDLYNKFNKTQMNLFPFLTDAEVGAILKYIGDYKAPSASADGGGVSPAQEEAEQRDMNIVYGVLALILAVLAIILMQVNANLKKLALDKEGIPAPEPLPFWKNNLYIGLVSVILFLMAGYFLSKAAMGLGRSKSYQPKQPIFFSHKVHAGINQISCQYCHVDVYQGGMASYPSQCMNCHLAINEYRGKEKIYDAEGNEVNGTNEIKKLYSYFNYTPGQTTPIDYSKATPIEWVRIHELPNFVRFSHAQHVNAGRIQCQICHGDITKMDEVKQFSDLSMGFCVNCHRTTQVQFKDNGFYSMYTKYHQELKNGVLDSTKGITVEQIGGTECGKCHY